MELKYGLISCDSHAQPHKDAFTSRMSKAKWGDAIPHLAETTDKAHMAVAFDRPVQRWLVHGQVVGNRGVVNCPTVMADPMRKYFPQHWDEVPSYVYNPADRLGRWTKTGLMPRSSFPTTRCRAAASSRAVPSLSWTVYEHITTRWRSGAR